jgi:hypothetical protein
MTRGLLRHAPTQAELERLYHELAKLGAPSAGRMRPWSYRPEGFEDLLALAGEMLRYDPRLLTVLLQLVLRRWREIDVLALRRRMGAMRWPQALLVAFEFARAASTDRELRYLVDHLAAGWARIDPAERFFVDAERPGSRMAARGLGRNLRAYARWGFVGTERPIADGTTRRTVGRYDARTRMRILDDLAARRETFTLAEYLEAIDHAVSRQQARHDLAGRATLAVSGHGRGARWRRRTSRPAAGHLIRRSQPLADGGRRARARGRASRRSGRARRSRSFRAR